MMDDALFGAIDQIVASLSAPLTEAEQREGWDEALKCRWRDWFENLRNDIEAGNELPAGWGILRAMNFDGVDPSGLARQASKIGRMIDTRQS